LKSFFARATALLPCIAFGLAAPQSGLSQTTGIVISDYNTLNAAVQQNGRSVFASNATVTLHGAAEVLRVKTAVVLDGSTNTDGTTNTATISRASGLGPMFYVYDGGSLTLLNLTITGGLNTNGGAIFNAAGGTLIISNCVFTGNTATNTAGQNGANATLQGGNINGGDGGSGLSAAGGAKVSHGTLEVYYSVFNNNTVTAGGGGNGGNGIASFVFGGNGGNAGSGGSAEGGAIVCSGANNTFIATDFTGNQCVAGSAGTPGSAASSSFSGNPGSGGIGGSSAGGAILASGSLYLSNCLFAGNSATGGNTTSLNQDGGAATGGGLDLTSSKTPVIIENTTFYQNSCSGGAGGGNSSLKLEAAGNGGNATGGGLASGAALTFLTNCTLATNMLTGGAAGVSTTSQSNGLPGLTLGFDLAKTGGTVKMAASLLFGGTNSTVTNTNDVTLTTYLTNTQPNVSGSVIDLGYNMSSDTSVGLSSARGSIENVNPVMDTGLSAPGGVVVGLLNGSTASTLAVLSGSPPISVIPGIPGINFPAYDQVFQARSSPTTIGAYEANPLDLTMISNATNIISQGPENIEATNGETVKFQVFTNINSIQAGFQWRFKGAYLTDSKHISGALSNILTIHSVSNNDAGYYSVIAGFSTLDPDSLDVRSATLSLYVPATITVEPPRTVTPEPLSPVNLSVTAVGDAHLYYQWYLMTPSQTNALSDSDYGITGSASSNLTVYPLTNSNFGSYFVVVSNIYNAVTSSPASLSIQPPTLAVQKTKPEVAAPTLLVQGTATGEFGVDVLYNLNGGAWTNATGAAPQTNWSANLILQGGTNTFMAYSEDPFGQRSKTNSVVIFYQTNNTLAFITNGTGKITRSFTNSSLPVGVNYTVTAVPGSNWLFLGWTGAVTATSNPLTILLESNTSLAANFVTNFFIPAAGTYNGLFCNPDGVTEGTAGMISNLVLKANGAFSGEVLIAGTNKYPLSGSFDNTGHAAAAAGPTAAPGGRTSAPTGQLQFALTLEQGQIVGAVSSALWPAQSVLTAELAANDHSAAENYTMLLLPPAAPSANTPPGVGYALVTNHAGTVTLSGKLADGTPFSQSVAVSQSGDFPVYAGLYHNAGLLFGWVNMTNLLDSSTMPHALSWIAPSVATNLYPAGFTDTLSVRGALWTAPPANTPAIAFANEETIAVSDANLSLAFNVTNGGSNTLAKLGDAPANSLTGFINPTNGLFSVTFGNGQTTVTGTGAVLQSSGIGAGFFVTASGGGLIRLQPALAPVILQQPAGRAFAPNTPVHFSVQAIGGAPLSFQWYLVTPSQTNALSDTDEGIAGSASSNLTIYPLTTGNFGSYFAVVSNPYGQAASSLATLSIPPPTLTNLTPPSTVTAQPFTMTWTASGALGVARVLYQINGGSSLPAANTQQTNWTATVALQAGTNILSAHSVDPLNQKSAVNSVAIFYETFSPLTLLTNGFGTISPIFTSNLVVGASYTVSAAPSPGNLFSGWTGTITSGANPLTFLMQSNMTLTANFFANFFPPFAGTYNGLFATTNVAEETSGMLRLQLNNDGSYSCTLYIAGTTNILSGSFNAGGQASNSFGAASAPGGPLVVDLALEQSPVSQITGTVSSNSWVAYLTAEPAAANQSASQPSARYTMLFSNAAGATPPGDGYATVSNNAGAVTIIGAMADGTQFSQSVAVSQSGDIPIYAGLYGNPGLLLGWVNLTNLMAAPPANTLTWIKKASSSDARYPGGFTNTLSVQGGLWTNPPPNTPAISLDKGDLIFTNAGPGLDFTVAVLNNNSLAKLGGNPANWLLSGSSSINPKNGLLSVTISNGVGAVQGLGAILQSQTNGGGFFLTSTNAGALILQP
jgi:hypothetical protein